VILKSGTFRVGDYRKSLPARVRLQVLINSGVACECAAPVTLANCGQDVHRADDIQFNHVPPLEARDYDTDREDFIPSQFDESTIRVELIACHRRHTSGTKSTTRGSVVGERARTRNIATEHAAFLDRMGRKVGQGDEVAATADRRRQWPSRKLPTGRKFSREKGAK
jgi:hypothetical protein